MLVSFLRLYPNQGQNRHMQQRLKAVRSMDPRHAPATDMLCALSAKFSPLDIRCKPARSYTGR